MLRIIILSYRDNYHNHQDNHPNNLNNKLTNQSTDYQYLQSKCKQEDRDMQ